MSGATCLPGNHYVPERFDDVGLGQCARCGVPIRWDDEAEVWVEDDTIVLLALTAAQAAALHGLVAEVFNDPNADPRDDEELTLLDATLTQLQGSYIDGEIDKLLEQGSKYTGD